MERAVISPSNEHAYWHIPEEFQGIMNYNPRHDIQDYLDLKNLNAKIPEDEYAQLLIQTNNRTKRQLGKAIGERFGVEKSTIEYFIDSNGRLVSVDYNEPVVERYEKGRKFLAQNGSTETEREATEVRGIIKVQNLLNKPEFLEDQTIIIVSPQGGEGSLYKANYFDIYRETSSGITMTRYHSTHNLEGFLKAAQDVDSNFPPPQELTASHFLETPIVTNLPDQQILDRFNLDQKSQEYYINEEIIKACMPYIFYYINTLIENPLNLNAVKKGINAIYNVADEADKKLKDKIKSTLTKLFNRSSRNMDVDNTNIAAFAANASSVNYYGTQPVRTVGNGPCPGDQKGFSLGQSPLLKNLAKLIGAFNVGDFGKFLRDDEDTSDFPCGGRMPNGSPCTYIVKYGSGIRKCPECGKEATCG